MDTSSASPKDGTTTELIVKLTSVTINNVIFAVYVIIPQSERFVDKL